MQYSGIVLDLIGKIQKTFIDETAIFYGILVYTKSCKLVYVELHVNFNISTYWK